MAETWVYLKSLPLFFLALTLWTFWGFSRLQRMAKGAAILNPVLWASVGIILLLTLMDIPYTTYFEGAQFIHFLLGPATVVLAVPVYENIKELGPYLWPATLAILAGSGAAALTAVGLTLWWTDDAALVASIAPKSVTAPVAMGIAESLGGLPSLTAGLVVLTGVSGAALGPTLLNVMRIRNWAARGLAVGTASHGIGTARALSVSRTAGAYASLAFGLNAVLTALLLPLASRLFS